MGEKAIRFKKAKFSLKSQLIIDRTSKLNFGQ